MSPAAALLLLLVPLSGHGNDLVVQHLDGSGRVSLTRGTGFASQPEWSPDGTKIAFVTNGRSPGAAHISVAAVDGSDLHAVTPDGFVSDPAWSPDGSQLAFLSGSSSGADVWTERADGSMPRRLTTDAVQKAALAWSPDGSAILYGRVDIGSSGLYALDPVTGGTRRLANVGYLGDSPAGVWSPSGAQIAFAGPQGHLSVMAADGSGARELDDQPAFDLPSWSPDGRTLAYSALRYLPGPGSRYGPYSTKDVWSVDVATGRSLRLTGPFDDVSQTPWDVVPSGSPGWWPDGSRLFFERNLFSGTKVWQMNADGTCEQPIPTVADAPPLPTWQPSTTPAAGPIDCVDLRVRIVATSGPVALGASAEATLIVENDGNRPATNVRARLTSTRQAQLSLTPCGEASCDLGTIPPGATRTFAAHAGGVRAPSQFGITIAASSDGADPTPADASAVATVLVLNCTILGTAGADDLNGTPGRDRICGLPGPDRIDGGKGDDYIDAGNGNDTIIGGAGRDTIIARGGRDVIYARDGRLDWIDCGTEYDIAIVDRYDHVRHCEKVVRR